MARRSQRERRYHEQIGAVFYLGKAKEIDVGLFEEFPTTFDTDCSLTVERRCGGMAMESLTQWQDPAPDNYSVVAARQKNEEAVRGYDRRDAVRYDESFNLGEVNAFLRAS